MKTLTLTRIKDTGKSTIGKITCEGNEVVKTLELPWKDNKRGVSCIPKGRYLVERHHSPSKGKCFHVLGVEGRSEILIHLGNYPHDSLGCILVGINHSQKDFVSHSSIAMLKLDKFIGEDLRFELEIV